MPGSSQPRAGRLRILLACAAAALVIAGPRGQTGAIESALRATVFLRVIGDIAVAPDPQRTPAGDTGFRRTNVEIATGSGVVISSLGQILTCHHVVGDGERTGLVDGKKANVTVKVRRIEAVFPGSDGIGGQTPPERYEASVMTSSADLDLAVLSVSGANFPTVDLGDSDALEPGDSLDTIGYPFGQEIEIGRPLSAGPIAPGASVSHGDFSAFRTDAQGLRRFLQTSASINPGNSGGPVVDADGYVAGIVSRRLATSGNGTGVGFALPINLVKEFLETSGLDGQLPARRMALGPLQAFEGKGLRARLPWGLSDVSPFRARVDTGGQASAAPALRIDRVVSAWDASKLAEVMARQQALEPITPTGASVQRTRLIAGRRVLMGHLTGSWPDGTVARMEFAVTDLGQEKILARYVGPANLIAYNASIFRASLASIEADALRKPEGAVPVPAGWVPIRTGSAASGLAGLPLPSEWIQEPDGPLPCEGLATAAEFTSASPPADFSTTIRLGVIRQPGLTAGRAASSCGPVLEDDPDGYQRTLSTFGTRLLVAGRFLQAGPDWLIQCEVIGPVAQQAALRDLLAQWFARISALRRRDGLTPAGAATPRPRHTGRPM
jgi:S1-C subfamily serine protease